MFENLTPEQVQAIGTYTFITVFAVGLILSLFVAFRKTKSAQ